ncbi:MAG: hypothetical protein K6C99_06170 [Lachnospiraceae bacterium]|nr:hypothetical protein [Lachnospiraceae bacterium]
MININPGNNENIIRRSSALTGYTFLIELVRKYEQEMGLKEAICAAIDECIDSDILADFLSPHRNEVEKLMNPARPNIHDPTRNTMVPIRPKTASLVMAVELPPDPA